ncbi:MAG: response regulator, partial [Treponema sp.]|nr:response regulator [Treponema sp.]
VEAMGGTISVESTPGVGSKFTFELTFDTIDANDDTYEDKIVLNKLEKPAFEGEVLLCEDNLMNQQVICEHLTRVGLTVTVAENGKVGLDIIKNRIKMGDKPFDLIFMDIQMPVMDGLETTEKMHALNTSTDDKVFSTPIIALTANIMSDDKELYKKQGMNGYIGKPFSSQELWRCLMRYLTPVTIQKEKLHQTNLLENKLRRKLITIFVQDNKGKIDEIKEAIHTGDIKLAYRLAHTLKSNAAQLNKITLQQAAEEVEDSLKDGENLVTASQMEHLHIALDAAITELSPLVEETAAPASTEPLAALSVHKQLEELQFLLEKRNPECLLFIDCLRSIPGSDELIWQIEEFRFKDAIETLAKLKETLRDE